MKIAFITLCVLIINSCATLNITKPVTLSSEAIQKAEIEINNYVPKKILKMEKKEQLRILNTAIGKILPSSTWFCKEYSRTPERCKFIFRVVENKKFNAFSTETGGIPTVIIYSGIFDKVTTVEEVAFIVAHELAHHINSHLDFAKRNASIGNLTGQVLGIAIVGVAAPIAGSGSVLGTAIDYGAYVGETVGETIGKNYFYSALQESEADYTALLILQNAWLDMNIARNAILKVTLNKETEDSFFRTHPSGPDRLAGYDFNLKEFKKVHTDFIKNICEDFKNKRKFYQLKNCLKLVNYDDASRTDYFSRMQETMRGERFKPSYMIIQ
tara:strand:+ start:130 stop:1110 length:981 start_codon:yes stop_codon:yes gene_type:complete